MAAPGYFRLWRLYAYSTARFPEEYPRTYPNPGKQGFRIAPVKFSASLVPQPKINAAFPFALV